MSSRSATEKWESLSECVEDRKQIHRIRGIDGAFRNRFPSQIEVEKTLAFYGPIRYIVSNPVASGISAIEDAHRVGRVLFGDWLHSPFLWAPAAGVSGGSYGGYELLVIPEEPSISLKEGIYAEERPFGGRPASSRSCWMQ